MKKWIIIGAALTLVLGLVGSGYLLLSSFGGADLDEDEFISQAADVGGGPVEVGLGTVSSLLVLDATVQPEPGKALKANKGGTVTHLWLDNGAAVENGAPVLNVSVPAEPTAGGGEDDEESGPATTEITLYAPTAGTIRGMGDVRVGDVLEAGATVATVAPDQFRAVATVPANDLYRLYDNPEDIMLKIDKGPPATECEFIGMGAAEEGSAPAEEEFDPFTGESEGSGGGAEISCRIPSDLQVFEGVKGKMSVSTGEVEDVVVIPVTAVRGTAEEGEVIVVGEDGTEENREVGLGLSDGQFVEVTEGLEVGETIMDPVPLDPRFDIPGDHDEDYDEEFEGDFYGMGG
ncbi:efflux RND transporter periplasmic adaptor subunit [Nocardiopsis exhalans]|uniref:Efflux RND transporter periplasmic adaptor subunit n=1 Tax=Nocardiopsis exhalans TaxID=163604 RepID=A0ABY5D606_9ACTN|nr:HlyD family efflux transporter periplasmic adaptor subunit [Nocardiopsis exhalans]USY19161.1 efflux RND transporter periplasmic adaptor subunit [Nocardiopsis exhalans]